jgi:archaeosine-15-forming tRNA-guanine transglycosylase
MMDDRKEDVVFWVVSVIFVVGIIIAITIIATAPPKKEPFTELYFVLERAETTESTEYRICTFQNLKTYKKANEIWIDFNNSGTKEIEEIFNRGDTFSINGEFWSIVDLSESQILFGKYPTEANRGKINFSFVIVNHLGKDYPYKYIINIDDISVFENSVYVVNEGKEIIYVEIDITQTGEQKISISLNTGQEIHFYIIVHSLSKNF